MTLQTRLQTTLAATLALVAAGLCSSSPAPAQQGEPQEAPGVEAVRAELQPIPERLQLSGTVVTARRALVSSELGGLVAERAVELGERVEAGQTLLQLDDSLAAIALQQAEAATREAREALADAEREVGVGRRLAGNAHLPQNELDARRATAAMARAVVERLEAEEARERERLRRHAIRAPFGGVVARRLAEAGEWVVPGTGVVELVELDPLYVDVPVPQRHYRELREGAEASVALDGGGESFPAAVEALVPVADPTARTFLVRLRPEAGGSDLVPGMAARVTFALGAGRRGVVVPRDAVIRHPDRRTTVWVLEGQAGDWTARERIVELGRGFDGLVHVVQGLEAGSSVVVRGNEALSDGQAVALSPGSG